MITQIYETKDLDEAKKLTNLGVDHVGVIVGSGRCPREVSFEKANRIFNEIRREAIRVASTIEWSLTEIDKIVRNLEFDVLHIRTIPTNFFPANVKALRKEYPAIKIMRSIPVISERSLDTAREYDGLVDYLLLDSYEDNDLEEVGATGKTHNWDISKRIVQVTKTPSILGGGIGPGNAVDAIRAVNPKGVDSRSKTDRKDKKGKDLEKVEELVSVVKGTNFAEAAG